MNPVYTGFKDMELLKVKLPKPIFSFVWKFMLQQDNTKPPNVKQLFPVYSLACD